MISGFEHNAVVRPLETLKNTRNVSVKTARAPLFEPEMLLKAFDEAITDETKLAVCTHISNVFGYILPIRALDELCYARGVPLIIDASQSAGAAEINFGELKAARFLCCPGHKGLYGPQGTGVLICRDAEAATLIEGGTGGTALCAACT